MQRRRSGVGITGLPAIAFARGALRTARSQWLQRRRPLGRRSATPMPRTQPSGRGWPDYCMARMMRKANREVDVGRRAIASVGQLTTGSPRTRSSAPDDADDSYPREAVVCAAAARRLLSRRLGSPLSGAQAAPLAWPRPGAALSAPAPRRRRRGSASGSGSGCRAVGSPESARRPFPMVMGARRAVRAGRAPRAAVRSRRARLSSPPPSRATAPRR